VISFLLAAGPSSLRSPNYSELRRTRRSLGEGGHPGREFTLMLAFGSHGRRRIPSLASSP